MRTGTGKRSIINVFAEHDDSTKFAAMMAIPTVRSDFIYSRFCHSVKWARAYT